MAKLLGLVVVAVVIVAAALWPRYAASRAAPGDAAPTDAARPADGVRYRGVSLQLAMSYNAVDAYTAELRDIAALGANTVMLCTSAAMEHAKSQSIYIDARKTPSPEQARAIIQEARRLNLNVFVMPILLLKNPRGSEWRGVIDPPDWETWWGEYREFVLHFADIAREGGADGLMIGSELVSTEKYTAQWLKTIEAVRQRFPGRLGYSANWDHYKPVQFWDKLDFVGITSYYTLADRKSPTVDEIVTRWQPIYEEISAWQRQVGKPIILTEVGWCSQEGAAMAPWNYYQNPKATPEGHEEQRRLYEAFLRVWDGKPALHGVIWWEWVGSAGGPGDYGYTPKGKPAEALLRKWFEQGRTPPAGAAAAGAPSTP